MTSDTPAAGPADTPAGAPYAAAEASAARLAELTGQARHDVAVVLGSGWAPAADALGAPDAEIPLADLGGFPVPTVGGHASAVRSIGADGLRVLVFLGRIHLYEGHPVTAVVHGVAEAIAARHLGAEVLAISLVSNLAAGLAPPGRTPQELDHAEVIAAGKAAAAGVGSLLAAILPKAG